MKILIDTNIYLDFYRSNKDALKLLSEIAKHFDRFILTDQIIQEFTRNREVVIKNLRKNFETESSLENFSSSYLQNLEQFVELMELRKLYKLKRKEVIAAIEEILKSPEKDPVATFFDDFVNEGIKNGAIYATTDKIIAKAHRRKLVGNPPASDGYSIGDEINWEIILENIKEDIFIVGRDNTYTKNFSFLQRDFHRHTGYFIQGLRDSITKALDDIGIATSVEIKTVEENMISEIRHYNDYWKKNLEHEVQGPPSDDA